jgi:hypothetical protein
MEEDNTQHTNPDSVFLNPEYIESLNQVPEITDNEFREFILTHNYEMPPDLKRYVDEYMANPLNHTDSKVLGWIKDWIEHPEKSKIYRDKVLFKNHSQDLDFDDGEDGTEWKIEIPLFSIDF